MVHEVQKMAYLQYIQYSCKSQKSKWGKQAI